jgi:hypothetical protein
LIKRFLFPINAPEGTEPVTAIKLRKKLPLLLERVGVRRIKIRQKTLFDPLILTFSLREKGLSILNLARTLCGINGNQLDA